MMLRYPMMLLLCAVAGGCNVNLKGPLSNQQQPVDCSNGPNYTGCPCTAGAVRACYTGPVGTEGVGACKAGTQTCSATGELAYAFGDCTGEVLPSGSNACGLVLDAGTSDALPDAATISCTTDTDCPHSGIVANDYTCAYASNGGCSAKGQCVHVLGSAICDGSPPLVCTCDGQTKSLPGLSCGIEPAGYVGTPIQSPTSGACPGYDGGM
jgi:hypothetical protein